MKTTASLPIPPLFYTFPPKQSIGRFAPSPTGELHFGSLIAATASYLSIRQLTAPLSSSPSSRQDQSQAKGKWLLRIEDVDTQRCKKEYSLSIIKTLEAYGFEWDGDIIYQSQRNEAYQAALDSIQHNTYPCSCTRKKLQASASSGKFGYIYPGFCRDSTHQSDHHQFAIRIKTNSKKICFKDQCQKEVYCQNINKEIGDFILKRRDGLFAYQLAVVVDDAWQGVTQVVRGADLFDNTPRQIFLQQMLAYSQPDYLHFPVAVSPSGKKLSKQNAAPAIPLQNKRAELIRVLKFLGQNPPNLENFASLNDLWQWAIAHWNPENIAKKMTQIYPESLSN